jgi:hypothetical protein
MNRDRYRRVIALWFLGGFIAAMAVVIAMLVIGAPR